MKPEDIDEELVNFSIAMRVFVMERIASGDISPLAAAAVTMSHAMSLYRDNLNETDYDSMMELIVNSKNRIEPNKKIFH
tara:strand:+ start:5277 stop:5513 length:237 start_codon:yes stop_codon:yes gene_type:complete